MEINGERNLICWLEGVWLSKLLRAGMLFKLRRKGIGYMSGILKKTFVLLLLLSFIVPGLSRCIAAPTDRPENIKIIRYQMEDFFIPQISGMADYPLQDKINNELRGTISRFNRPEHYTSLWGDFDVTFYNRNLLGIHFIGANYTRRAAHPNKFDFGVHVDLTTGVKYELSDLFKAGIDYENRIKELCRINEARYRLTTQGGRRWTWDGWTYEQFARAWIGDRFLLSADFIRVYDSLSHATGYFSGYSIPYVDLADIINQDGPLWKAMQSHEPILVDVELEKMGRDDFIPREYNIKPRDNASSIKLLGDPKNKVQVQDGLSYDYGDIEIIVNSKDMVANIITDNKKISTRRWVHPGTAIRIVKERYGENFILSSFGEYDLYEYPYDEFGYKYILRFAVKQGTETVSYISWRILEP